MIGKCRLGDTCNFAHGDHELRKDVKFGSKYEEKKLRRGLNRVENFDNFDFEELFENFEKIEKMSELFFFEEKQKILEMRNKILNFNLCFNKEEEKKNLRNLIVDIFNSSVLFSEDFSGILKINLKNKKKDFSKNVSNNEELSEFDKKMKFQINFILKKLKKIHADVSDSIIENLESAEKLVNKNCLKESTIFLEKILFDNSLSVELKKKTQ